MNRVSINDTHHENDLDETVPMMLRDKIGEQMDVT